MAEEIKKGGFNFYLRFAKPLVINLPDPTDRILAAGWIQKLRNHKFGNEELRTNYLKLLLFVLQRKKLIGPFRENPNTGKDLEEFPANIQLIDIAKALLLADAGDRKDRLRDLITSGSGDFPPYSVECSADLLEYAAAQDIPKFGVHAYYAISNSPITSWDNVDFNFLPKGVSLDQGAGKNIATAASSPEVVNKSQASMSDSRSKSRSRTHEKGSPKSETKEKSRRIPTKAISTAKSPLGSAAPVEDRSPPTWGSNLIEVTDPPDETAFNISITGRAHKAEFDLLAGDDLYLDASSSHVDLPYTMPHDQSPEHPDPFRSPTDRFVDQFNRILISPGTEKSRDIIDEVNKSLLESGRQLSLSQAEAEVESRYPHRRQDMPRTPPVFSKHQTIRDAGRGIQYSPQQFGISQDESFGHGPSMLEGGQYSPRGSASPARVRVDARQQRLFSSALDEIEGQATVGDDTDNVIDDFADELEKAIRTPKNVQRKLKELLDEIGVMKETTPAMGGVPVTTPRRSPSPGRKIHSTEYNVEDELALFTEDYPDLLDFDYDQSTAEFSPDISPQRPGTPKQVASPQTPRAQIIPSPRTRAARLRPESPPTPEKPSPGEFRQKTISAQSYLRPRKMRIRPTSVGREIKVYTRPVKHYKHPEGLNQITESPEYRRTEEDRLIDLYEKLMAEDLPGDLSIRTPPSAKLKDKLTLSPLSPVDKYFGQITGEFEDISEFPDVYESPERVSPLKQLQVQEQITPDVLEDIQFKFDYNPLDLGGTADMEDLYGDIYEDFTPHTAPHIDPYDVLGSPLPSPERPRTPPRMPSPPRPPPIPSPQFYEMENVLTPQEFQEAMQAHEFTDRHISRDPDRRLASQLRTPRGGHRIPLPRNAPRPQLETIADRPMFEQILMDRERLNPPAPPSPLTPDLPWRKPLVIGGVKVEDLPEDVQEKLMEPVPQRELKEWEKFMFDTVIKSADQDYFIKLFNEYNITNEELIHPDLIRYRGLRSPRRPPRPFLVSPPAPVVDVQGEPFPAVERRVVPPPQVHLRPDEIPESWDITQELIERARILDENIDRELADRQIADDGGLYAEDDGLLEMSAPLIDDIDFTFESPKTRIARLRPPSPPTPEKPTYEELIANARAARKKRRPSKMLLGTTSGGAKKHYTRPLRHYEPLAYLDRIDESPYVSPEVDWEAAKRWAAEYIETPTDVLQRTPQRAPGRKMRGQSRMPDRGPIKPRRLKFTNISDDGGGHYLAGDSTVPDAERGHYNKLLATLPELPPEPLPEDLMGHYYEHKISETISIIDKDVPEKHLKHQRQPLSPKHTNILFPDSPVTPPISPVKMQSNFDDHLNQEMYMDFPEDIQGEIEMPPDPYAFMAKMPTRLEGFEEDIMPQFIGTEHEGFTGSPVRPMQQVTPRQSPATPRPLVSPGSPIGLDTFFQIPQDPDVFKNYTDPFSHEMWMEYEPVDYMDVQQYPMDPPPKPKSPPKPKTPPQPPRGPSPKIESPLPTFITPERLERMNAYTRSPSPFLREYAMNTPPHPKHKYVLTPTRPSPYKESHTPPGMPPAFEALEASPIPFNDYERFAYIPSPEYMNADIDQAALEDFDFSFASSASSPYGESPAHLTATPPSMLSSPEQQSSYLSSPRTPQISPQAAFSPLPSPVATSQNMAGWDLDIEANRILAGDLDVTPEIDNVSGFDIYASPVCSPERPCGSPRTPPAPPSPMAYKDQFGSPTQEEFNQMMQSHEYTERHVSRDPHRKLATKVLRSTKGNKPFRLERHGPKPTLPTIFDYDETPEQLNISGGQMQDIPSDLYWQSPEGAHAPPAVPQRYDTTAYEGISPERDYRHEFIKMIPTRNEVRRNLFDEFEDSGMEAADFAEPKQPLFADNMWFESPKTPPRAFSPQFEQRIQRSVYDGSEPYRDYPEVHTPPSGSRRRMRTYTPPGGPSPVKPTEDEIRQNIAASYAVPTPHTMGVHSRTGYIKNVATRPVQEYYSNRMDLIEEVGEQNLTPPSGLRRPRRTYTPQQTPIASPRLMLPAGYTPPTPPSIKRRTYTPPQPESPPSPHLWFPPSYTPPPHLRWSPLNVSPSPPRIAASPQAASSARRKLFDDSPEFVTSPRTPRTPHRPRHASPSPDLSFRTPMRDTRQAESSDDEFVTPELSPSRIITLEQEIVYNVRHAFTNQQDGAIHDTSDIDMEDNDNMDFKWMD